ncbi:MAG: MFS transporter [Pyrinomonadaceae bacterium]
MESTTYGQLLRGNRNFRNLLAGQVISELGNWFNFIASLGLVRVVSEASPMAAGILFVCRLLPFAVFSPIAGTFVDRFSRRQVMIVTDLARVAVALMFLLVTDAGDLWIAYVATVLLSTFGAFFDGAKNAATPNLTGKEGLLAGTALMFSTRFLLMAIGSALGGWAAAIFGYEAAFLINAASFLASAYTVWLIPEESVREQITADRAGQESFLSELRQGLYYAATNHFALTIILMNVIWAVGAGAINIVFERMGGVIFVESEGWNPDVAVALLWTASGFGLFLGMMIAHRTSIYLDRRDSHYKFIGWMLIVHGILFAVAGVVPSLWMFMFFVFISRMIIGVEYAVQETLFQRSLPDYIRGRISTLERGAEMSVFGISSWVCSVMIYGVSAQTLTIFSGLFAASAGIVWLIRERGRTYSTLP